jgi:AbrB family looped-hinge helix DNA binding protein
MASDATVTSKGQIVIPVDIRRRYGIRQGTKVSFIEDEGRLILQPLTREFIDSLKGSLKGGPSLTAIWQRERKKDWPRG